MFFGAKLQQQKVEKKDKERSSKDGDEKRFKCMYKLTLSKKKKPFKPCKHKIPTTSVMKYSSTVCGKSAGSNKIRKKFLKDPIKK